MSIHPPLYRYNFHYIDTSTIMPIYLPLYRHICRFIDIPTIISTHPPLYRYNCHYADTSAIISIHLPLSVTLRSALMYPIEPKVSRVSNQCANQKTAKNCVLVSDTPSPHSMQCNTVPSTQLGHKVITATLPLSTHGRCRHAKTTSGNRTPTYSCTNTQFHTT